MACPLTVSMEGYNGYARPIDKIVFSKGYRLLSVNNNKLAQFKKEFAGPAKTEIDTLDLFRNLVFDFKVANSCN